MTKYIWIGFLVLVLGGVALFLYEKNLPVQKQMPSPTPFTSTASTDCTDSDLEGVMESEGAAGNIYVKVTISNKSGRSCNILLGNSIEATYDLNIKNIAVNYKEPDSSEVLTLKPGDKVYSQLHFPNGPQCQSETNPQNVSFNYKELKLTANGKDYLTLQACRAENDQTVIDIWPLSKTPINGVQ